MGESFTVNSDHSYTAYCKYVRDMFDKHHHITFSKPRIGKDRGLNSNALSHVWYNYADKMLSYQTGTARRYCKLHFGVPILRAEDVTFMGMYDKTIRPFQYELKLEIMDYWPVTSLMSRDQMTRYLTAVQVHYAANEGLVLESKGEFQRELEKLK